MDRSQALEELKKARTVLTREEEDGSLTVVLSGSSRDSGREAPGEGTKTADMALVLRGVDREELMEKGVPGLMRAWGKAVAAESDPSALTPFDLDIDALPEVHAFTEGEPTGDSLPEGDSWRDGRDALLRMWDLESSKSLEPKLPGTYVSPERSGAPRSYEQAVRVVNSIIAYVEAADPKDDAYHELWESFNRLEALENKGYAGIMTPRWHHEAANMGKAWGRLAAEKGLHSISVLAGQAQDHSALADASQFEERLRDCPDIALGVEIETAKAAQRMLDQGTLPLFLGTDNFILNDSYAEAHIRANEGRKPGDPIRTRVATSRIMTMTVLSDKTVAPDDAAELAGMFGYASPQETRKDAYVVSCNWGAPQAGATYWAFETDEDAENKIREVVAEEAEEIMSTGWDPETETEEEAWEHAEEEAYSELSLPFRVRTFVHPSSVEVHLSSRLTSYFKTFQDASVEAEVTRDEDGTAVTTLRLDDGGKTFTVMAEGDLYAENPDVLLGIAGYALWLGQSAADGMRFDDPSPEAETVPEEGRQDMTAVEALREQAGDEARAADAPDIETP